MPITPHHACKEPSDDTIICRFMEMWKFRDFFANEELYFRRTDLFKEEDPWEALPSEEFVRMALGLRKGIVADEVRLNNELAFIRQVSEVSFLNCWQLFDGETAHMWDRYGKEDGVAIFSTFAKLKAAVGAFLNPVLIGKV